MTTCVSPLTGRIEIFSGNVGHSFLMLLKAGIPIAQGYNFPDQSHIIGSLTKEMVAEWKLRFLAYASLQQSSSDNFQHLGAFSN